MAFDFPSSPAVGDISNGYQWDGEKWRGGMAAREPDDQFFDLSGLATKDIVVPTWAKAVHIEGAAWVSASAFPCLRLSTDGTTFLAGASDYINSAMIHNTGSVSYSKNDPVAAAHMLLGFGGDNVAYPQLFSTDLNVVRPGTSGVVWGAKTISKCLDAAATTKERTFILTSYNSGANWAAVATIKALRFLLNTGNFANGSYVRVKWIGAQAQQTIAMLNKVTISTADPSGGAPGDIWFKVV